jgi:hypothetical protein
MTSKPAPSHPASSTSRPRPHRPQALALTAALACALPACFIGEPQPGPGAPDAGPPPDLDGQQVRTTFLFQPVPDQPAFGIFLVLDRVDEVARTFAGSLALADDDSASLRPVSGTLDERGELSLVVEGAGSVSWSELRIAVRDQDGDGVYESGTGHMSGTYSATFFDLNEFAQDIEAAPEAFTAGAAWAAADTGVGDPAMNLLIPWQPIAILLAQPVSADQATRYRVLADGQEVAGETVVQAIDGMVTSVEFVPHTFYPLSAEILVESTGMENALGVPVTFAHDPIPVLADPGPAGDNLGFEQGLAGWSAVSNAFAADVFGDVLPVEGVSMAVVGTPVYPYYESRLIGYLDVPADATEIDLSVAVLVPEEVLPSAMTVRLYHDDALDTPDAIDVYTLDPLTPFEPCDCRDPAEWRPLTRRAGPFRRQLALDAFRGQRVFLELRMEGHQWNAPAAQSAVHALVRGLLPIPPPPPPVPGALIIDDIQIR